jgi:hypothetical protein
MVRIYEALLWSEIVLIKYMEGLSISYEIPHR